jgi:hypothetical protein
MDLHARLSSLVCTEIYTTGSRRGERTAAVIAALLIDSRAVRLAMSSRLNT